MESEPSLLVAPSNGEEPRDIFEAVDTPSQRSASNGGLLGEKRKQPETSCKTSKLLIRLISLYLIIISIRLSSLLRIIFYHFKKIFFYFISYLLQYL